MKFTHLVWLTLLIAVISISVIFNPLKVGKTDTPQIEVTPTPMPSEMPSETPEVSPVLTVPYESLKGETIEMISPVENGQVVSPFEIRGFAPGYWFFEATFPVVLTDWNGLIIAEGYATAQEDWMTESMVLFTAELEFEKPSYGERGSLILQRSNASGLPANDDAVEFVIFFGE
jgi:hypothetical protein